MSTRLDEIEERRGTYATLVLLQGEAEWLVAELKRLRADAENASWLLDGVAENIDEWFPDDTRPTIQNDMRELAQQMRERFGFRQFVPDSNGGHLSPTAALGRPKK
jgi:hypothetical protein